jgi:hypothetical protein
MENSIEALLYAEEQFRKIASHTLLWTTDPKKCDGFKEVLRDTALKLIGKIESYQLVIWTKHLTILSKPFKKCIVSMLATAFVFQHNMFLHIPLITNLQTL